MVFPLFCHLSAGQQVRNCPFFLQDRDDLWATHGVTCCCQCSLLGSCTEASLSAGYDFNIKCTIFCLAAIARNYKLSCTAHLKLRNSWGLTFYRWKYKAYWIYHLTKKKKSHGLVKVLMCCEVVMCVRERGGEDRINTLDGIFDVDGEEEGFWHKRGQRVIMMSLEVYSETDWRRLL